MMDDGVSIVDQIKLGSLQVWRFNKDVSPVPPWETPGWHEMNGYTPVSFLRHLYSSGSCSLRSLLDSGVYKLGGWVYVFKPWLKRYLVLSYGTWECVWAPNRQLLRKGYQTPIKECLEVVGNLAVADDDEQMEFESTPEVKPVAQFSAVSYTL